MCGDARDDAVRVAFGAGRGVEDGAVTREEAMARLRSMIARGPTELNPASVEAWAREALKLIDEAPKPSRIEAAERAVVEAALDGHRNVRLSAEPNAAATWLTRLREACARLRDLRERAREEECEDYTHVVLPARTYTGPRDQRLTRCHLPRGHEGEHRGELGEWRWT